MEYLGIKCRGGGGGAPWALANYANCPSASPCALSDLRYIRLESIPYPGSNLSHFDGISWNQMPGEGVPPSRALAGGDSAPQPPAHWDSGMWLALQNASCDAFWLARLFSYKWCSSSPPPTPKPTTAPTRISAVRPVWTLGKVVRSLVSAAERGWPASTLMRATRFGTLNKNTTAKIWN